MSIIYCKARQEEPEGEQFSHITWGLVRDLKCILRFLFCNRWIFSDASLHTIEEKLDGSQLPLQPFNRSPLQAVNRQPLQSVSQNFS